MRLPCFHRRSLDDKVLEDCRHGWGGCLGKVQPVSLLEEACPGIHYGKRKSYQDFLCCFSCTSRGMPDPGTAMGSTQSSFEEALQKSCYETFYAHDLFIHVCKHHVNLMAASISFSQTPDLLNQLQAWLVNANVFTSMPHASF